MNTVRRQKNGYCSFHELQLAYQLGIPIIVVQMCENWPPKPSTNDLNGAGAMQNKYVLGRQGHLRLRWHRREWNADECAEEIADAFENLQRDASSSQDISNSPPIMSCQPLWKQSTNRAAPWARSLTIKSMCVSYRFIHLP